MRCAPPALLALLLSGCSYAPPPRTDTASAAYKTDYAACDSTVPDDVAKRNAKTGLSWIASPLTRWSQIDSGMSACMESKGWGRTRPCTDEERRSGGAELAVTARGIQCVSPRKPVG